MDVDESSNKVIRHANVEEVDDEEFFEFEQVESLFNNMSEEEINAR
jgi:hypothetical protein